MNGFQVGHVDVGFVGDPATGLAHQTTERLVAALYHFGDYVLDP